jgi:hypothetical protein
MRIDALPGALGRILREARRRRKGCPDGESATEKASGRGEEAARPGAAGDADGRPGDRGLARSPPLSHRLSVGDRRDFAESVGFVEAGLRAPDHCVVVGDRRDNKRILGILERRGLDIESLRNRKRLTVLERTATAQTILGAISEVIETALAAGVPVVRLFGNVGWAREAGPSDAELLAYEARLTEMARRSPCVTLCLHEVNA